MLICILQLIMGKKSFCKKKFLFLFFLCLKSDRFINWWTGAEQILITVRVINSRHCWPDFRFRYDVGLHFGRFLKKDLVELICVCFFLLRKFSNLRQEKRLPLENKLDSIRMNRRFVVCVVRTVNEVYVKSLISLYFWFCFIHLQWIVLFI